MNLIIKPKRFVLIVILTTLIFTQIVVAGSPQSSIKFGVVPQFDPVKLSEIWKPILNELEKKTGLQFEMVSLKDIPSFEKGFQKGDFDFAYMNPYHAVVAYKKQKYVPIINDGDKKLFGILVINKESAIRSVKDLNKKKIAFPAPNALGASLLMRAELDRKFKIKIEPIWAKTHTSAYLNAVLGKTDAAGGVMGTFNTQEDNIKNKLKIIYKTDEVPTHPIVVHPRISKKDREKIIKALIEIGDTEEGRQLLNKIPITRAARTSFKDYEILNKLHLEKYYIEGEE